MKFEIDAVVEYDDALNEASLVLLNELQKHGEVSTGLFNNLKGYLRVSIETYLKSKSPTCLVKQGDRVVVKSGFFSAGAHGEVVFVYPGSIPDLKVWVQRDGAGSPCYYHQHELDKEQ